MKKHRNNIFEGILLLDEVEQNLHPEWQRLWFSRFNDGLKMLSEKLNVQMSLHLIMTIPQDILR
jgi:predicted ATP-binding protein involved in virulence